MRASVYERIRCKGKTFLAKIIAEGDQMIYLRKVDKFGDETEDKQKDGVTTIQEHLIDKSLITKRTPMVMSLKYAELEPVNKSI